MDTKSYKPVTIVGRNDIISYLETRNDGNPNKDSVLEQARAWRCSIPAEVFRAVAEGGAYRTDLACRINTVIDEEGKLHSSPTHVYDVLVRQSDGAVVRIIRDKDLRCSLAPLPLETAHGPVFIDADDGTIRSHLTDAIRTHVTQHGIPAPPWYGGGLIVPVAPLDFFSMSADPYVIYAGLYGRTEQPLTHITRDDKGRLEEHILLAVILTGKQISFLTANEDARQEIADYEMRAEELLCIRDLLDKGTSASTRDWLVFNAAVYLYSAGKGLRIWSRFDGEYHPEHEPMPCPLLTQINDNNDAAIRERLLEELSAGGKDPDELIGDDTFQPENNNK